MLELVREPLCMSAFTCVEALWTMRLSACRAVIYVGFVLILVRLTEKISLSYNSIIVVICYQSKYKQGHSHVRYKNSNLGAGP